MNEYPANLLKEVYGENQPIEYDVCGLEMALQSLTERENFVLSERYTRLMTYDKIGKSLGVSRERIRQICKKALRKLRHPSRLNLIKQGADYNGRLKKLNEIKRSVNIEKCTHLSLDDVGLSVRTYNVLRRAGFQTFSDIAHLELDELMTIKNCGRRTIEEIQAIQNGNLHLYDADVNNLDLLKLIDSEKLAVVIHSLSSKSIDEIKVYLNDLDMTLLDFVDE